MQLLTEQIHDDRARPVTVRRAELAANINQHHYGEAETFASHATVLLPYVAPLALAATLHFYARWPFSSIIAPALGAFIAASLVSMSARRYLRPLTGLTLPIPTVVASGHCGGCGYAFTSTPPDPHGFHTCAECGAVWHAHRLTLAHRPLREKLAILRRASRITRQSGEGHTDDRGVALDRSYRWPRGFLYSSTPPHAAASRAALNKRLGLGLTVFTIGTLVVAGLLTATIWADPHSTPRDKAGTTLWIIAAGAIVFALARMARLEFTQVRATLLAHAHCPSCWGRLPTPTKSDFDNRTRCPTCNAAWNVSEISPNQPGDQGHQHTQSTEQQ